MYGLSERKIFRGKGKEIGCLAVKAFNKKNKENKK